MPEELISVVGELDQKLLDRHRHDTSLFEELDQKQRELGLMHDDRPFSPFLRPYFLERSRYDRIRAAAAELNRAFESMTAAALEYDEIITALGMSEKEARWARIEPGYPGVSLNSRFDTFLSGAGFAFLEYNAENPAGIGDQPSLESLYSIVPAVQEFLADNDHYYPSPEVKLLDALVSGYRDFGGKKVKPNIAIVDWDGVSTTTEFEVLKEYFEASGHETVICDPGVLEYEGPSLTVGDFEIDIFYKRVLIHEFLDKFDESGAVYRACVNGAVCMANSFRSKIPHKKAGFAVLTDERYNSLFTPEQLELVRLHIPWTRTIREEETTYFGDKVDLLEYIRAERQRFVMKPNDDYGGHGITFGWESTESEWDDAIEHALKSHHLVQERVPVEKTQIPTIIDGEARLESLTVDFDPFLFRGKVEGGMVRLAAGSLVNVTSGGGETALAIVEKF